MSEQLAKRFHEIYESCAHDHGYETRKASAVEWGRVPYRNKALMIYVCGIIEKEFIATLQKEALKVYQLDGSCVEMETAEKVVEFRKGCAKLLETQAHEIDTLQKDNDTLNTDLKEAKGAVVDLMELNDKLSTPMEKMVSDAIVDLKNIKAQQERAEKAEAERDNLFNHCKIVFYHDDGQYPIEHNMAANKDSRSLIEEALNHKEK